MDEKYKVKISTVYSQLIPLKPSKRIFDYLYGLLAYDIQNSYFIKASSRNRFIREQWDGQQHLFSKANGKFLTGHLDLVLEALESSSIPYEIEDFRPVYKKGKLLDLIGVEEREYQKDAVKTVLKHKRGRIWARPRSGKTIIEIMVHSQLNIVPHISICQSIDIAYQTKEKFETFLPQVPVGVVGDGKCDIKPDGITIITIQSAIAAYNKKYELQPKEKKEASFEKATEKDCIKKLIENAKIVWVDEAHHSVASSYRFILTQIKNAEYIVGGSGTLFREDNTDLYIEGLIGPLIHNTNYSDLIGQGYLIAPTIHMIKLPRNIKPSGDTYPTIYKECITENDYRNDIIKRVVQNLELRDKSSMILVSKIKHGEILQKLIPGSVFLQGKDTSDFRIKTLKDLKDKKLMCLITTLGNEGLDIPNLDAVVIAAGGKSAILIFQRLRCLTPYKTDTEEKKHAIVVDFLDSNKYLKAHSNKRKRLYKSEELFKVVEKDAR